MILAWEKIFTTFFYFYLFFKRQTIYLRHLYRFSDSSTFRVRMHFAGDVFSKFTSGARQHAIIRFHLTPLELGRQSRKALLNQGNNLHTQGACLSVPTKKFACNKCRSFLVVFGITTPKTNTFSSRRFVDNDEHEKPAC